MRRRMLLAALVAMAAALAADEKAYDIGKDLGEESFWKSDPVLFVKRHEKQGFQFTSGSREGADTRLDGAVVFHGTPVYETQVSFGGLDFARGADALCNRWHGTRGDHQHRGRTQAAASCPDG